MKTAVTAAAIGVALVVSTLGAQPSPPGDNAGSTWQAQPPEGTARGGSAGQAQTTAPRGQMPDLGRPTKPDDQLPLFNFDEYFPGKWTFEWDVPEGPLGPAGRITGTTVYKPIDGRFYEANTDATGPGGAFKSRGLLAYHKRAQALSRYVIASRGV